MRADGLPQSRQQFRTLVQGPPPLRPRYDRRPIRFELSHETRPTRIKSVLQGTILSRGSELGTIFFMRQIVFQERLKIVLVIKHALAPIFKQKSDVAIAALLKNQRAGGRRFESALIADASN